MRIFVILTVSILLTGSPNNIHAQGKAWIPKLRLSSTSIEKGDSAELTWEVQKALSVRIDSVADNLPLSGSIWLKPDTTTFYKFVVTARRGKEVIRRRKINVVLPKAERLTAPKNVTDEEKFNIFWLTNNARYAIIKGLCDSLSPSGSMHIQLDTSTVFTLIAVGKYHTDSITDTVHVKNIEDFSISNNYIYRGDSVKLSWKTKLSKGVSINGSDFSYPPIGSLELNPPRDTTFNLLVKRRYGVIDTFKTVSVKVLEPSISYFWGDNSILKGDIATLSWSVHGGESVSIDGFNIPLQKFGSLRIKPEKTTNYTLRVKIGKNELTREWKIKVYPFRKYVSSTRQISDVPPGVKLDMDILSVDRSHYPEEIVLRAVVVDTAGNYISGLAASDSGKNIFKKYFFNLSELTGDENTDCPFTVKEVQESASTPYDIALVLDYSGSMNSSISFLQDAVRDFIAHKYLNDRISVTKFDSHIVTESQLSAIPNEIFRRVSFYGLAGFGGQTALYAGCDKGLSTLDSSKQKKVVVLFTDGNENSSFQYFGKYAFTAEQLAHHLRDKHAKLFIIAYGPSTNTNVLMKLASLADGSIYFINSPENITKVFEELPRVLHQYYEIRYKPVKKEGLHKVHITYNTLTKKQGNVYEEYTIGNKFTLKENQSNEDNYWYRVINGKKPVSPPQVAVNYIFNEAGIRPDYKKNLDKFLRYLKAYPEAELDILAHADHVGTAAQCMELTRRRADQVKQYFINNGIAAERLHTRPFGKEHPIWPDEKEAWQAAENRRVELILLE